MKHLKLFALALSAFSCVLACAGSQAPIIRYPAISSSVHSNMLAIATTISGYNWPKYLITLEGQFSDEDSSLQNEPDHFVVYCPGLPGRATVLKVGPLPRSGNGIMVAPVVFTDMLNGGTHSVDFDPMSLCGWFSLAGQKIWMKISYGQSTDHPRMQLTWGDGSGYGSPGAITDCFDTVFLNRPMPTNTTVAVSYTTNATGTNAYAYVGILTTNENVVAQWSTNLTSWSDDPNPPLRIDAYTQWHAFLYSTNRMFFRSRTTR